MIVIKQRYSDSDKNFHDWSGHLYYNHELNLKIGIKSIWVRYASKSFNPILKYFRSKYFDKKVIPSNIQDYWCIHVNWAASSSNNINSMYKYWEDLASDNIPYSRIIGLKFINNTFRIIIQAGSFADDCLRDYSFKSTNHRSIYLRLKPFLTIIKIRQSYK